MNKPLDIPAADRVVTASDNAPPDPFDAHRANIGDLYEEAKNWLDGNAIENAKQAEAVESLLDMLKEAHEAADKSRVKENEPFDVGKAAVQAKYAPLISDTKTVKGLTVKAMEACKAVLTKWKVAERARQDAIAAEARRVAQEAADKAARAAQEAAGDLGATEQAEALVKDAQEAQRVARAATMSRVTGLRDHWVALAPATPADENLLVKHFWTVDRPAIVRAAMELAQVEVRAGKRQIPGIVIENQPRAV